MKTGARILLFMRYRSPVNFTFGIHFVKGAGCLQFARRDTGSIHFVRRPLVEGFQLGSFRTSPIGTQSVSIPQQARPEKSRCPTFIPHAPPNQGHHVPLTGIKLGLKSIFTLGTASAILTDVIPWHTARNKQKEQHYG